MLYESMEDISIHTPDETRRNFFGRTRSMFKNSYLFGHSERELRRLAFQADLLRPITERMLSAAHARPGGSVLDIGCGEGSVSRLAGELTGPHGYVLGIDHSEAAVARARALTHGTHIHFRRCSFEDAHFERQFDIVTGRAVLLFQPDVVTFLRKAASCVKPGGYLAFHEIDDGRQFQSKPKVEIWDLVMQELLARLRRGCPSYDIAQRMVQAFARAGLLVPTLTYEIPVEGGRADLLCRWAMETLRSLSSDSMRTRLPSGRWVDFDVLLTEMQDAISAESAQVEFLGQACAWVQCA
jgi:2-polyprenyl-3-methyl-5-hydroxy-6-metoxy-1,4-benzoquinol methylase